MPTLPKTGPSLFLGIELATDQLRASIVDETLDLVGVENVDFDSELSEYQCVFLRVGAYSCPLLLVQNPRGHIHDSWRSIHNPRRNVA